MTIGDVDVYELNEAFAAQVLPIADAVGFDMDKLNPHGGAIALGHPFGMTGARILITLLNDLERRDGSIGLETMCVAQGQGEAMLIERLGSAWRRSVARPAVADQAGSLDRGLWRSVALLDTPSAPRNEASTPGLTPGSGQWERTRAVWKPKQAHGVPRSCPVNGPCNIRVVFRSRRAPMSCGPSMVQRDDRFTLRDPSSGRPHHSGQLAPMAARA